MANTGDVDMLDMEALGLPSSFSTKRISRRKKKSKRVEYDDGAQVETHAKHDDNMRMAIAEKQVLLSDLVPIEKTDAPGCVKTLVQTCCRLNDKNTFDPAVAKESVLNFTRNVMETLEYWKNSYEKALERLSWHAVRKVFERRLSKVEIEGLLLEIWKVHQQQKETKQVVSIIDSDASEACQNLVIQCAEIRAMADYEYVNVKDELVANCRAALEDAGKYHDLYLGMFRSVNWSESRRVFTEALTKKQCEFVGMRMIEIHQPQPSLEDMTPIAQCDCPTATKSCVHFLQKLLQRDDIDTMDQTPIAIEMRKIIQAVAEYESEYLRHLDTLGWKRKIKHFPRQLSVQDLDYIALKFTIAHQPGRVSKTKRKTLSTEEQEAKQRLEWILNTYQLPITHEAIIKGALGRVSCTALDKKGSRLITGSWDGQCRMYNFAGMDERMQNFRHIVQEGDEEDEVQQNPVISLSYSPNASHFLCVYASCIPTIYDREGDFVKEFVRGDSYLRDVYRTKGHTMACSGGMWHPREKNVICTWSFDSTFRYWDINKDECTQVVKARPRQAERQQITAACLSQGISKLVLATRDGGLQVFDAKGRMKRPKLRLNTAHERGTVTSSVLIDPTNDCSVYSRGGDHTVKIWDLRKFTEPIKVFDNLPNNSQNTNLCFSPNQKYILTGTSHPKKGQLGSLVFLDRKHKEEIYRTPVCDKGVLNVHWNKHINQIFMSCGDKKCRILYNPQLSNKGALMCAKRKQKKKHLEEHTKYFDIFAPNDLPEYKRDMEPWKTRARDMKKNPGTYKQPYKPDDYFSVENSQNKSWQEHVLETARHYDQHRKDDPREAILRFADKAKADPLFTNVYQKSQPKRQLDYTDEEEEARKKRAKYDLKLF